MITSSCQPAADGGCFYVDFLLLFSEAVAAGANENKDYVVGLVSDSLTAGQTTPGTLSSLFSVAATQQQTLRFVPAPKPKAKTKPANQEAVRVPGGIKAVKPKTTKQKSAGEKKLEDREGALQNADDAEEEKRPKKVKRKASEINHDEESAETAPAAKRHKVAWNKAEERIKLKRTVFVGNLPVNCSKKDLKNIFKGLGLIESVRFRSVHDHKKSIFVGNLPYDISELPLRQHFEECGKVEAVRLVRDRNTGIGKGFGYVLFESTDAVMLALKLNNSQLLDRKIRVKRSVKKEKVKKVNEKRGRGPAKGQPGQNAARKRGPHVNLKGPKRTESGKPTGKHFKKHPERSNQTSSSFKGNMTDPVSKKGKGMKKKFKPKKKSKPVHI
ncbi:RNA-binding protein 34 [Bagarius yarrelli]|uniref:RNA-binding protein 34 n=1 Tax=Bagarius yarrelli TaxID=175774 RepID=A0A556U0Q0_BAGYA|nr:RNA-binding protein 34 [Bagarius yarrelli]